MNPCKSNDQEDNEGQWADIKLVFRTESFSAPNQSVTEYSMIFLSSRYRDALSTGDWTLHGVRVNESWDAGDNWNDADKNGDRRTMRQRRVTEHSDYIILPQDWAQNIFCDYRAWTLDRIGGCILFHA